MTDLKSRLRAITPTPIRRLRWSFLEALRLLKRCDATRREAILRRDEKRYFETKAAELSAFYFDKKAKMILPTVMATGETHNFTYDLTDTSLNYLAHTLSAVTGETVSAAAGYIAEAVNDDDLNCRAGRPGLRSPFGRRLGWYAMSRIVKPRLVVETGVDRGHGSLLLCASLLRNAAEGHPGRYVGTDLRHEAGQLLQDRYREYGRILYGDSITSLQGLDGEIDLFINDSDHSGDYEYREYLTIEPILSERAVILGDNAHATDSLERFSRERGRRFLFFREQPLNHWYPGAGIGFSFH